MSSFDRQRRDSTGESPPAIGALGRKVAQVSAPLETAVLVGTLAVGVVLTVGVGDAVRAVVSDTGYVAAIWLTGLAFAGLFALAVAVITFLPPLLLRGRDRSATAVHVWIGARESRRAFGRASRSSAALGTPERRARWLATTPPTDALRPVRFEALLSLGRIDEARAEADRMPERTPVEAYRRLEAQSLVDEQTGLPLDEPRLREAIGRIPRGVERTEAAASLAVALARRALPDGDWRRPLVEVRPMIGERDIVVLARDLGLPRFELMVRRLAPFFVLFLVLAILFSVMPTILR